MTSDPGPGGDTRDVRQQMQSQMNEAIAKLTGPGEPLIALGAALLVFVDLVGDIFMRDYSIPYAAWVPAILIVLAIAAHRFMGKELPVTYGTLLAVLALVAGLVIVRELIDDVRFDVLDRGGATVFFALVAYVGGAVSLVGAWQVWPSVSALR